MSVRSAKKNRPQSSPVSWRMFLFGFVFFAVGAGVALGLAGSSLWQYYNSTDWQKVPADIIQLNLERHSGETTTWSVTALYRYQFGGNDYTSDRVALLSGSDNIGDYWQQLHARLQQARNNNSLYAWVNPQHPNQALLDRTLRWGQIIFACLFGMIFMLFGGGIMAMSLLSASSSSASKIAKQGIPSNERHSAKFYYWFGGIFILIISPLYPAFVEQLQKGHQGILLLLLFPLIGLCIVMAGLRQRRRYKTIGATPLFPDPLPGCAGGQVGGHFLLTNGNWVTAPKMQLSCVHSYSRGSGDDRTTERTILWQQEIISWSRQTQKGTETRFVFDVPAELPASGGSPDNRGDIGWRLTCEGTATIAERSQHPETRVKLLGASEREINFSRSWDLPVTAGTERAQHAVPVQVCEPIEKLQAEAPDDDAAEPISIERTHTGFRLISLRGRNKGMALIFTLMGLGFAGAGAFMLSLAIGGETALWFIASIFLLLGLPTAYIGVALLGRGLVCEIDSRQVHLQRTWFGLTLYRREAALHSADQLELYSGMSSTDHKGRVTQFFRLQLRQKGKPLVLAEGIEGKSTAEQLREELVERLFAPK